MSWAGGVWSSSYGTSTDGISFGMQVYYDKKFLSRVKDNLFMWDFGQKRPLPQGSGKQIRFFRYHDPAITTTPLTEGTNPDPTLITGHEVNRTLEEFGAFSQHSSLVSRTHIDRGLSKVSEIWGDHAGRTIDLRVMKEVIANSAHQMKADVADGSYNQAPGIWAGTVSGTTSTSTLIYVGDGGFQATTANLSQTNDFWINGQITFTSGANYGESRVITDSDGTAKSLTVTLPFENAPAVGDTFIISHPGTKASTGDPVADTLASTDILTFKTFQKLWEEMKVRKAQPFSGGFYYFVMGPTVHANFMSDSTWVGMSQYQPSEVKNLKNGEVGKFMGFKVITTTQPFRAPLPVTTGTTTTGIGQKASSTYYYDAGYNYSATGTGHWSVCLGQEAYGVTHLPGYSSPKIIVKNPGPSDTSNPLNRFSTVGWELPFITAGLNGLWAVSVVSGG